MRFRLKSRLHSCIIKLYKYHMLAVTRKVIILIPLCFVLTHFMGFKGVYLSEGIADLTAGIITSAVIFTSFPRIFREREELVKKMAKENEQEQA